MGERDGSPDGRAVGASEGASEGAAEGSSEGASVGSAVGPEFRVHGYARPFEASGAWRIQDSSGQVVKQGRYSTADWTSTWGAYSFRPGYPESLSGERGTLQVGSLSARDGSFTGVTIPLYFR